MILSQDETVIVSSIGWADAGALWVFETRAGRVSTHKLSDAKYLSLHPGTEDHFAVVHHADGEQVRITAHSFANPPKALAGVTLGASGIAFEGEAAVWRRVPRAYVAYLKGPGLADYRLLLIDPARPAAEVIPLDWYGDSYDKDYQAVIGVAEVPDENKVLFSVQRDSHPVLYDLDRRAVVTKLSLAGRGGNPTLHFTSRTRELWADDYDTLLRLSPPAWGVKNRTVLQGAGTGCRQFIGAFSFNRDESQCVVARPFSGDVVALNTKSFRVTHTCRLGHQPLHVSLLSDGTVFSRDWKTGALLSGQLKKKWFA